MRAGCEGEGVVKRGRRGDLPCALRPNPPNSVCTGASCTWLGTPSASVPWRQTSKTARKHANTCGAGPCITQHTARAKASEERERERALKRETFGGLKKKKRQRGRWVSLPQASKSHLEGNESVGRGAAFGVLAADSLRHVNAYARGRRQPTNRAALGTED
jgi:hypothetical protein